MPTQMETPLRGEALRTLRGHVACRREIRSGKKECLSVHRRASLSAAWGPFHAALAWRDEAEARVQAVHVLGGQDPAQARIRAVLDRLAHELDAESTASLLGQPPSAEQPGDGGVVRGEAAKTELGSSEPAID